MIGDVPPIRFSRRIKRKASLLPIRVSPKRKIKKSAVKKRNSGVNSSLKVKEKTKKNKLEENPKLSSKILKEASCNLNSITCKSHRLSIPKIHVKKRNTGNCLKTSQANLTNKKVIEKKICEKLVNEENQSVRKSLRLSKFSPLPKEKAKKRVLSDSKLSNKTGPIRKKNAKQATVLSSELVFTPNFEKCTHVSKYPRRKKSTRLSSKPQNQEIIALLTASKSLAITPVPRKDTRTSRRSGNRKSERLSKKPNRSRKIDSEISLCTFSLFATPQPERHSEKRRSSRFLEPSPLRTLNTELPLSKSSSLLTMDPDSTLSKSSKSCKSIEFLSSESHSRKRSMLKVSNKGGSVSLQKRKQKQQVNQHKKTSKNFKQPLSNETENVPFDVLSTPAFKPPCKKSLSKKYVSKSDSKSSKRKLNASTSENQVANAALEDNKKRKSADFPQIPTKGTLKHKRWLLNNLKEKNGNYEDDIFENQSFDLYKSAFHFGDESDGSSVNIATPKFDSILTPALPRKTPRFKDCISPTEFLQARKTAEEYLYRRNKKRKSGEKPSSVKKTSAKKKDIPEKKKLDFEEAVNKLITVQKNLEIQAEVHDEEEDSYFSDASN